MDFELSEEQRLLKDSVERLCTQRYEFETRRKYMTETDGWSRDMWRQYVDLGLAALPSAAEHGRAGRGAGGAHDRDEALGPRARAGAVSRDGRARRRFRAARRKRRSEERCA